MKHLTSITVGFHSQNSIRETVILASTLHWVGPLSVDPPLFGVVLWLAKTSAVTTTDSKRLEQTQLGLLRNQNRQCSITWTQLNKNSSKILLVVVTH